VMRGNYDVGLTELAQALGIARRQGDVVNATIISADIGNAYLERGELEQARSQLGQALIGYHKVGMPGPLISVLQGLGMVNHYLGRYAQAEGYLLDALDQATKAGDERLRAYALANLGELERETNRLSSALDHLVEAVLLARERDLSQLELFVIMALGDVCRRQGDRERAHDWLRQALHHHYAPTCRREVAEAWLAMGALQRDWGLLVESGQSLACALDMAIDTGHQRLQG